VSETACPFCGASFDAGFRAAARPQPPARRLARAALFSLGTTSVAFAPGCALVPQDKNEGPATDAQPEPIDATTGDAMLLGGGVLYGSAVGMSFGTCKTVDDCAMIASAAGAGEGAFCCVDEQCLLGASASAVACADPAAQQISAANYDQACDADTDCVAIAEGDFCTFGVANCPNAAINKASLSKYQSDVANTNAAFCRAPGSCGVGVVCGDSLGPWCLNGMCETTICPPDAGAAIATGIDAGGGDAAEDLDARGDAEDGDAD
jgi:hypothetical protein